jgi:hypothetical protein
MVAQVHNIDPKILLEGSEKLRWAGRGQGTSYFIASVVQWKEKALDVGGQSSIDFIVERLYYKRPIQCLASFKILTPTPSLPGECVPHCLWCGVRTHSLGGEGVGGQYFGRRQTQLCTLHM